MNVFNNFFRNIHENNAVDSYIIDYVKKIFKEADQCLYFVKESGRENLAYISVIEQRPILYQERKS